MKILPKFEVMIKVTKRTWLGLAVAGSGTWEKDGKLILCGSRQLVAPRGTLIRFYILGPIAFIIAQRG